MAITPDDIRNIVVLGHRGAGKTELVEAMLYLSKAIPRLGHSGGWAGGFDATPEEAAHIATLESRVVSFRWRGKKINVFDTPGEAAFVGQTKLGITAADAALLLVSAKDSVQSGTERLFRWVREAKMPCLVVITKMDDEHAHVDDVVNDIRQRLDSHTELMEVPEGVGPSYHGVVVVESGEEWPAPEAPGAGPTPNVPAELRDAVQKTRAKLVDDAAASDDKLTEHYLEAGDLSREELDTGVRTAVVKGQMFPLYECAPLRPSGVAPLLDAIVGLLPSPAAAVRGADPSAPLVVFACKSHVDPHAGRMTWVRVLQGTLRRDASLVNVSNNAQYERVGQVMELQGPNVATGSEGVAGDVVAVPKLKFTRAGDTLAEEKHPVEPVKADFPAAVFSRAFLVESRAQEEKIASALHQLVEEDPTLSLSHEGVVNGMLVGGVGSLHLDITAERVKRMTGITCRMGPPRIPYKETVTKKVAYVEGKQKKQTGGHGQFGVCYLDVEPMPRGSGFEFEDAIVGGVIPRQFIPSVEKGVRRALDKGIIAGFPVVDLKVRVVDGKFHSVDSSDAAFQVAGYKGFVAAAAQAQPSLLEPVMKVEVKAPAEALGDVIGDLTSRHGKVLNTDTAGEWMVVSAFVPMAQMLEYEPKLTALTSGRGSFMMHFDHYDYVAPMVQEKIVAESGFKIVEEE